MAESRHIEIERRCETPVLKALVVDDQELNRRVMSILLQEFGCVATLAACGEEAIDYAAAGGFDVIFMDLNMPGLSGQELARRARGLAYHRPIVAISGRVTDDERIELARIEITTVLQKPFTLDELRDGLTRAFAADR